MSRNHPGWQWHWNPAWTTGLRSDGLRILKFQPLNVDPHVLVVRKMELLMLLMLMLMRKKQSDVEEMMMMMMNHEGRHEE